MTTRTHKEKIFSIAGATEEPHCSVPFSDEMLKAAEGMRLDKQIADFCLFEALNGWHIGIVKLGGKPGSDPRRGSLSMTPVGECETCGTSLFVPMGYAGTDLCGPCCTGEAATLEEMGAEW